MRLIDADALKADYGMANDCNDCRQDLRSCQYDTIYSKMDFCGWIDDMPTVEPMQWIPCSERMPDNKSYVLTTISIPGRQPHARSGWYEDGLFMNDNGDTWNATDMEVKAWMPLPEPYQEDKA